MSKMAADYNAINLSQGFPDFPISEELAYQVTKAMRDGHNQYAPMPGHPLLQESIGQVLQETYGWEGDPHQEITITDGATEALYCCITALVSEGDEVIILEPAYDSYKPAVEINKAITVPVPLDKEFNIDWEKVATALSSKTKMIIINSPHNPTGALIKEEDLDRLSQLVLENDVFILSDEVYERIIFDGQQHHSVLDRKELRSRCMAVFSFGKTFHVTGWKIGYVVASPELMVEIRKIHQFVGFSVNTPAQVGIANFLKNPDNYLNLGRFYQERRDYFLNAIADSRFTPIKCSGTYFQTLSYEGVSDRNDMSMAEWLTKEKGLASIPISVFCSPEVNYDQKLLRFCFAKNEKTLSQAADILCKI